MSSNSKPVHFLDLTEADLQEWRALPQTGLLLEALRGEAQAALKYLLQAGQAGHLPASAYQAAWHDLAEKVANSISETRVPKPMATGAQDDTYVDPATRPSKRRAQREQVRP